MIWVQHDFYKNFIQSVNSHDIDLTLDIFRSELSDLLTYQQVKLFSLFDKLKISYGKNYSYERLLDIIIRELQNEKFVRGLSFTLAECNEVVKKYKDISWEKLLNNITTGIKKVAKYFLDNPRKQSLFKKKAVEMLELKSSVTGNDNREVKTKDNTILWVVGIGVLAVAGYLVWRHFDKIKQERLRADSLLPKTKLPDLPELNPVPTLPNVPPQQMPNMAQNPIDPDYTVPSDVLLPEVKSPEANSGVQINVQIPQKSI